MLANELLGSERLRQGWVPALEGQIEMDMWTIFLIIAVIALIGVLIWAIIKLVAKSLELLHSLKDLIDKIKTSDIIDQLGAVLRQFAELEDLIKTKLGVDEKKKLDEMKETLENIRRKIG